MISKNTQFTIISKVLIILSNFGTIILSTQFWGAEGRGEISLIIADISIITIFSSMLGGSTIAFHVPKMKSNFLFSSASLGAIIFPLLGGIVFSFIHGFNYFPHLFFISLLISITNTISLFFLGKKEINWYNIILILSSVLIFISLTTLYFIVGITDLNVFFYSYYLSYLVVAIIGVWKIKNSYSIQFSFDFLKLRSIFKYGFYNELNYLIQFLNYRLAYYFIAFYLGKSTLGIFSIAIAISEAILVVSKSLSAIHYADIINMDNQKEKIDLTIKSAKISFALSSVLVIVLAIVPSFIFELIFGEDFADVKRISLLIMPGIMGLAISNLYGHYFSGIGRLDILRNKSIIGLIATISLLFALVPTYQLSGVLVAFNFSYLASSLYLFYKFYKEKSTVYKEILHKGK